MLINSIGALNSINRKNQIKTGKVSNPTFKQQNYLKVFNREYDRVLQSIDGQKVSEMYVNLRDAAAKMQPKGYVHFYANMLFSKNLYETMGKLCGRFSDPDFDVLSAVTVKNKYTDILSNNDYPIIRLFDQGRYEEDNILSQKIRKLRNKNEVRRDIGLAFYDVNSDRNIIFGLDYEGDKCVTRTHRHSETIDKFHSFYYNGRLKEVIFNGKGNRFNMDGSKWSHFQWDTKDIEDSFRGAIKLLSGWGL